MMKIFATMMLLLLGGGGGGGFLLSSSIISVVESFPLSSSLTRGVGVGVPLSSSSSSSLSFLRSRYDDKRNQHHHSTSRRDRQHFFLKKERRSLSSSSNTRLFGTKRMAVAKKASSATGIATILTTIWMKLQTTIGSLISFVGDNILQWSSWLPRQKLILAIVFILGVILGTKITTLIPQTTRFVNAMDIPTKYFGPNAPILKGRVVSVSDGDTFRFYHRPTFWHSTKFVTTKGPNKQKLSETTMPIRICTYDSPETPKFGKSGQPYGKEAKEKLESLLMNGIVKIRLLQKDQYGRAVAQVLCKNKGIDEIMLSEGLGEVYLGGGAVYGPLGKDAYLNIQQKAQKSKNGMWSLGTKRESAADYKRRTK